MRFLFVLAFVAVAYAGTVLPTTRIDGKLFESLAKEQEIEISEGEDGTVETAPQFILSWQVRRMIRKLQKQMPCGWEEYGIPPLAPYRLEEGSFHMEKGMLETFDRIFRLRVDGLDNFVIKKFKLNIWYKKITFDFLFNNINANARKYETDTIVDAMRQLGLSVQYEGDGTLNFGLVNLRIAGTLTYKLPVLWGSAKITSLKTTISLEKCNSEITGVMGDGKVNQMINAQLEQAIESGINDNQQEISDKIENTIVPKVNKMLKGNDFWTLIDLIFSSDESEDDPIVTNCVPPPDPWA